MGGTYTNIDWYDVGISTVTGAATSGLSVLKAAKSTVNIVKLSSEVTKATIDVERTDKGLNIQTVIDKKSVTETVIDLTAGVAGAKVDGSITKEVVSTAPVVQKAAAEVVESATEILTSVPKEPIKKNFNE